MSLEAWDDGGDVEDLSDEAMKYGYSLYADGLWREFEDEPGLTDQHMWEYIWDRRESDAEDLAVG